MTPVVGERCLLQDIPHLGRILDKHMYFCILISRLFFYYKSIRTCIRTVLATLLCEYWPGPCRRKRLWPSGNRGGGSKLSPWFWMCDHTACDAALSQPVGSLEDSLCIFVSGKHKGLALALRCRTLANLAPPPGHLWQLADRAQRRWHC